MSITNNKIILSIDYGQKRVGLAISEETGKLALPYETIENKSLSFVVEEIKKIVQEEDVNKIVVGLPKGLAGGESNKTELDKFVNKLKKEIDIPIDFMDERMTSKAADKFKTDKNFKKSGQRDKVAAAIILQDYLDKMNQLSC